MAKLYADEDFSYPVVEELRRLGHDVLTMQEAGLGGKGVADADVLAYAVAAGRPLITFNRRDFIRLHRAGPVHTGIVACTRDADSAALAGRIHRAIAAATSLSNQLVRVHRPP